MSITVFERARIVDPSRGIDEVGPVIVDGRKIAAAGKAVLNQGAPEGATVIDCAGKAIIPGLIDGRVFIGEPGGEHRETIASASVAAAAGGVTSIVMMPDTDPVIDNVALVEFVLRTAKDTAIVNIFPAAAITSPCLPARLEISRRSLISSTRASAGVLQISVPTSTID